MTKKQFNKDYKISGPIIFCDEAFFKIDGYWKRVILIAEIGREIKPKFLVVTSDYICDQLDKILVIRRL